MKKRTKPRVGHKVHILNWFRVIGVSDNGEMVQIECPSGAILKPGVTLWVNADDIEVVESLANIPSDNLISIPLISRGKPE